MAGYDLNRIGDRELEHLIQSLIKKIIGNDTITFGEGPDGGREATFYGRAPYPSETEQWDGKWIVQAKYHDTSRIGTRNAMKIAERDLQGELAKFVQSKRNCENYILATNLVLTPLPGKVVVGGGGGFPIL